LWRISGVANNKSNTIQSLVTGGAGAIGSRLVRRLQGEGHRVVVLDDLSSGFRENLPSDVEFIEGTVTDAAALKKVFETGFDYVFHLAALFAHQNSVDNPLKDLDVNGRGTLQTALAAIEAPEAKRLKKFVYVSSSCIYGHAGGVVEEDAPQVTHTPYAVTKLMGEYYMRYFHQHYTMPVAIVRPFNSYGPGERPGKYRNVIPNFMQLAMAGEPLIITGDGEETRDFTYVEDTANGMFLVAVSATANAEAFDLGTGRETKIGDLARAVVRITESKSEIQFKPRRGWDKVDHRCASVAKANRELGYEAKTYIEDGLRHTAAWLRSITPTS
jgi:UDP-glucose 4-epimerase